MPRSRGVSDGGFQAALIAGVVVSVLVLVAEMSMGTAIFVGIVVAAVGGFILVTAKFAAGDWYERQIDRLKRHLALSNLLSLLSRRGVKVALACIVILSLAVAVTRYMVTRPRVKLELWAASVDSMSGKWFLNTQIGVDVLRGRTALKNWHAYLDLPGGREAEFDFFRLVSGQMLPVRYRSGIIHYIVVDSLIRNITGQSIAKGSYFGYLLLVLPDTLPAFLLEQPTTVIRIETEDMGGVQYMVAESLGTASTTTAAPFRFLRPGLQDTARQ